VNQHPSRRPSSADEDLIACVNGPLSGQWFTATDWAERQAAAERMAAKNQRPTAVSAYTPAGHHVANPHVADTTAAAWTSTPQQPGPATTPDTSTPDTTTPDTRTPDTTTPDTTTPGTRTPDTSTPPTADAGAAGALNDGAGLRVLVTGSSAWTRPGDVTTALDQLRAAVPPGAVLTVVHGASQRGVDAIAAAWAARHIGDRVLAEAHPADWQTHGRAAGIIRNTAMTRAGADVCLAFIREDSPGASHCAAQAETAGIPARRWTWPPPTSHPTGDARNHTGEQVADEDDRDADGDDQDRAGLSRMPRAGEVDEDGLW
jgi:hypothetical protein